jgi:hypothetical protein
MPSIAYEVGPVKSDPRRLSFDDWCSARGVDFPALDASDDPAAFNRLMDLEDEYDAACQAALDGEVNATETDPWWVALRIKLGRQPTAADVHAEAEREQEEAIRDQLKEAGADTSEIAQAIARRRWKLDVEAEVIAAGRPYADVYAEIKARDSRPAPEAKPVIYIKHPDDFIQPSQVLRESEAALAKVPGIFSNSNRLVRVGDVTVRAGGLDSNGTPRRVVIRGMAALSSGHVHEALCDAAEYRKSERDEAGKVTDVQVPAPRNPLCGDLIDRGYWEHVRPVAGVASAPLIRPDGTVLQTPGYDYETGWIYEPSCDFPRVPEAPTQAQAAQALAALREPFAEFPWAHAAGVDLPVALVLTGIGRAAIQDDVPCFEFDASTPGTGKTAVVDTAWQIVSGQVTPKFTFPRSDEELEKILGAVALAGGSLVMFDNVDPSLQFGGAPLDKVLTSRGRPALRVLGHSRVEADLDWHAIVAATGNNLAIKADFTRRGLLARLEADCERPEERTGFRIANLRAWVGEHRPRLVVAALTLLRAYFVAGRPGAGAMHFASFEAWAALVAGAIKWAGGANVLDLKTQASADPKLEAVPALFEALATLTADGPKSAADLVASIYTTVEVPGTPAAQAREALETLMVMNARSPGGRPSAAALGYVLRRFKGQVKQGRKLVTTQDRTKRHVWQVVSLK